mmetsp:Transcript_29684/g.64122  ORF Transcript_29684/g.64122 Transcript_29684/m.64122 type:complete len:216 (-) Transcript_29684:116-763(-)
MDVKGGLGGGDVRVSKQPLSGVHQIQRQFRIFPTFNDQPHLPRAMYKVGVDRRGVEERLYLSGENLERTFVRLSKFLHRRWVRRSRIFPQRAEITTRHVRNLSRYHGRQIFTAVNRADKRGGMCGWNEEREDKVTHVVSHDGLFGAERALHVPVADATDHRTRLAHSKGDVATPVGPDLHASVSPRRHTLLVQVLLQEFHPTRFLGSVGDHDVDR